jgi:hypothetical protein
VPRPDIEEKLRKLAPMGSSDADIAWLMYLSGIDGERIETEELIDLALFQAIKKGYKEQIFLDPPAPETCRGDYPLGVVIYPPGSFYGPFGINEGEFTKHVLLAGMTGSGKTNLMFCMLRQLRRRGKPFLVFDWKRNYRDLLQLEEFADCAVYTVGRDVAPFKFNPLIPAPGCQAVGDHVEPRFSEQWSTCFG